MSLTDEMMLNAGFARPSARPGLTCDCGALVVSVRIRGGGEVLLDAGEPDLPVRVRRGDWTQLATTADVLGRRPLVVDYVGSGKGEHRMHVCRQVS